MKISEGTPQDEFLLSHQSDIRKEMGALKSTIDYMKDSGFIPDRIMDAMAGSGFSGKLFEKEFPNSVLALNDLDSNSADILERNFPDSYVFNKDVNELFDDCGSLNLVFIDFNNFTLKRSFIWKQLFEGIKCDKLLITDSACFGFKFGNLKSYKVNTQEEYYQALSKYFVTWNFMIESVCIFGNAALVLLSKELVDILYLKPDAVLDWKLSELIDGFLFDPSDMEEMI
jgi:hypothetical protein